MCGIAGIWRFNQNVELQEIETFTDTMRHRGPDGGGYHIFDGQQLAFGHRRLSILDLSDIAKQPMTYMDSGYWITYNGEIYNFLEIKAELEQSGFTFKSESDTEVILAAYIKWGNACLNKFNGMFAFAIYNVNTHQILIARDRFGVKPLHYVYIPNQLFAFASETIAFKHLQNFERTINANDFIFSIQSPGLLEPSGRTIFNDVYQLKPGHLAIIDADKIEITQWYNLSEKLTPVHKRYEEQVEHFKDLFFDACKLRLRSDVSVASALSGGMDSSSVFCSIQHLASKNFTEARLPKNWQQAFSISFPGTELDEAKFVKIIQERLHADVRIIENNYSNLVSDILSTTKLFDNITSTPIISLTDVYKAMHQNAITVSLDGHAGDELLFGYKSAVYEVLFEAQLNNASNAGELAELYLLMTAPTVTREEVERLLNKVAVIAEKFKPSLKNKLKTIIKTISGKTEDRFPIPQTIVGHANRYLYKQFHYLDLPYNLRDFDRAAMQNSIEIRMPMMDYRLVEYTWSLPLESKIGKGFTKRILRDAMKGIVPNEILERKTKIGLAGPTADWLNTTLSQFLLDTVSSTSFLHSPYWNGKELAEEYSRLTKTKAWTPQLASKAWCVINAHLIS
jgi:asparagine synthase (glutamine-hydrolysing)